MGRFWYNNYMGKITKIEKQKKAKDRVNIYIDDKFEFGISSLLLVDYDLYRGKEVTEEDIKKYKEGDDLSKCLSKAYHFLSFRMRSEKEMFDKLSEKYNEFTVNKSIEKLKEYNYINDIDFARVWVRSRKSEKSINALKFELKRKGVKPQDIEIVIYDLDSDSELTAAIELINTRKKFQNLDKNEAYKKIGGFLSRRGYSYDIIKKVIDNLFS